MSAQRKEEGSAAGTLLRFSLETATQKVMSRSPSQCETRFQSCIFRAIVTTEPSDKTRYKTEGRYKTERSGESNHLGKKEC